MNRRGVSPVIATVLLVLISIILAGIILVWAQSFVKEKAQKSGEPVEVSCGRISFEAEAFASDQTIHMVNRGDVPIYGVEIRKKGLGSEIKVGLFDKSTNTIANGESGSILVTDSGSSIATGDNLVIVPIILGESSEGTKAYTCDVTEKSEEITVQ